MFTIEQIKLIRRLLFYRRVDLETSLIQGYTSHPDDFQERKDEIKIIDDIISVVK